MSFEQISEQIRPLAAKMLLRQYRVWPQDLDDCLQNGLMYIWEQLAADRNYLSTWSRLATAIKVCYRSKSTSIRKQNLRYEYMEDFWAKNDFKHPEEMRIGGLERFKIAGEHWATWATLTDIRIDIERAVLTVYEQIKDDPAGLLALYAATTSVTSKDLAYVVPGKGEDAIRWRAVAIRNQLRGIGSGTGISSGQRLSLFTGVSYSFATSSLKARKQCCAHTHSIFAKHQKSGE